MHEWENSDVESQDFQGEVSDDDDEVEELQNSLREVVQDQSVKPQLQCLMVDQSFSMVTVQSEDSGIVWETASSRCSTPWASETSSVSEACSMEGPGTAGKITIVFDEEKVVRRRTRSGGRFSRLSDRFSRPGSSRSASALGVERPEMAEVSLPNVKQESTATEEDLEDIKNKDQQLFSLISDGFEILNIRVPSKLPTVDEEESTDLKDNLSYLNQTPQIRSRNKHSLTRVDQTVELEILDPDESAKEEKSWADRALQHTPTQDDYFEKFTLVDVVTPEEPAQIPDQEVERPAVKPQVEHVTEAATVTPSVMEESFVMVSEGDIVEEHLDEVFYGETDDAAQRREEELEMEATVRARRESLRSAKESGGALFASEETTLTPIYISSGPPKIIDQILLDEPTAMSFMYTDLYEDALGERRKSGGEFSEAESVASEKSYKRRFSDSEEDEGYLQKFTLKDETPADEEQTQPVEQKRAGRMMWSQSDFDTTGCLRRAEKEEEEVKEKPEEKITEVQEVQKSNLESDRIEGEKMNQDSKSVPPERSVICQQLDAKDEATVELEKEEQPEKSSHVEKVDTLESKDESVDKTENSERSLPEETSGQDVNKKEVVMSRDEVQSFVPEEVSAEALPVEVSTDSEPEVEVVVKMEEAVVKVEIDLKKVKPEEEESFPMQEDGDINDGSLVTETDQELGVEPQTSSEKDMKIEEEMVQKSEAQAPVGTIESSPPEPESEEMVIFIPKGETVEMDVDMETFMGFEPMSPPDETTVSPGGEEETPRELEPEVHGDILDRSSEAEVGEEPVRVLRSFAPQEDLSALISQEEEIVIHEVDSSLLISGEEIIVPEVDSSLLISGEEIIVPEEDSTAFINREEIFVPEEDSSVLIRQEEIILPEEDSTAFICQEKIVVPEVDSSALISREEIIVPEVDSTSLISREEIVVPEVDSSALKSQEEIIVPEVDSTAFISQEKIVVPEEDSSALISREEEFVVPEVDSSALIRQEEVVVPEEDSSKNIVEAAAEEQKEEEAEVTSEDYEVITNTEIKKEEEESRLVPAVETKEVEMEEQKEVLDLLEEEAIEADYDIIDAEEESQARLAAELEGMDWFCLTCDRLLKEEECREHRGHKVTTVDEAYEELKDRLSDWISELQGRSENIEDLVSELELAYNSVEDQFVESEGAMKAQNDEMMAVVMDQYNGMSVSMEEEKKNKLERLYDQIVSFQENIDSAKSSLETTAREAETEARSPEEIQERLQAALESSMSLELGPRGLLSFEDFAKGNSSSSQLPQREGISVPQSPVLQPQEPSSATSTNVTVYWWVNPDDIIDCFQVYCMEEPQGAVSEEYRVTVKESQCVLEELEPDKTYKVWVMAVNCTGCSLPSERLNFSTAPSVPMMESQRCTVMWDVAMLRWSPGRQTPGLSYTLEYCRQYQLEGEGLRSIAGIESCEHRVVLQPKESYLFYIKAVNEAGSSEQSEAALISTKGTKFQLLKSSAHPALELSSDQTTLCYSLDAHEQRPPTDKLCPSILGELLPASGRYYWETVVSGCVSYRLGVAYRTANKSSSLGENSLSWCLQCTPTPSGCRFQMLHGGVRCSVQVIQAPDRVGTLLDYQRGGLEFYDATSGHLLGSLQHTFTKLCHPAFALESPGSLQVCMVPEVPEFIKDS